MTNQEQPEDITAELKIGQRNSSIDAERLQQIHDLAVENGASCEVSKDDVSVAYAGSQVKAARLQDESIELSGYLVRFGSPDEPDVMQDFFTSQTDYGDAKTADVWLNHRLPISAKSGSIQRGEPFKNKAALKRDDIGILASVILDARDEYEGKIAELGLRGVLSWSSGTAAHLVDRRPSKNGTFEITRWPLGLDASLTPTPAEYRASNRVMPVKTLLDMPAIERGTTPEKEIKTMDITPEMQTAISDAVMAALAKAKAEEEAAEAEKLKAEAMVAEAKAAGHKQALEELKSAGLNVPAFNRNTQIGFSEERDAVPAFRHWMKTGQVNAALIRPHADWEVKAPHAIGAGGTGGYLVPDPLYQQIVAKRNLASWVRQAPVQMFTTPADHLLVPIESTSLTAFVETAEAASYDENEATFAQKDLVKTKYTKVIKASEEFVNFEGTNFDTWLTQALGRAEAVTENSVFTAALIAGSTTSSITTAAATAITQAELSSLVGKLGAGYNVTGEAGFIMQNATKFYLKGLTGNPFSFVATPQSGDFFGYTAFVSDDMEALAASKKSVIFGNFNYFGVLEQPGMLVRRNEALYMATGQIGIFATIYRGCAVLQGEAFYYMTQHA